MAELSTRLLWLWLWSLADHVDRGGRLDPEVERAARLVLRYLLGAAEVPCYDCWEEHPGHRHTSTLAAIAAGLRDIGALLNDAEAQNYGEHLRRRLLTPDHTLAGGFVRFPGDTCVDGSLLWIDVPFVLVPSESELAVTTVHRIRDELYRPSGGVRRYQGDTFYGGSEWIMLAASLGCVAVAQGNLEPFAKASVSAPAESSRHLCRGRATCGRKARCPDGRLARETGLGVEHGISAVGGRSRRWLPTSSSTRSTTSSTG